MCVCVCVCVCVYTDRYTSVMYKYCYIKAMIIYINIDVYYL